MKIGKIIINKKYVAQIREIENDDIGIYYEYQYDKDYLKNPTEGQISLTIPLSEKAYFSRNFPAFFENLVPEGWLLNGLAKTGYFRPPCCSVDLDHSYCVETMQKKSFFASVWNFEYFVFPIF